MIRMFIVVEDNGKFRINVEGLTELRPIAVLEDREFAYEYCENLNTAYNIGYENGSQLG